MTPQHPPELPLEANEADALEQRQPVADDDADAEELPDELPERDADPADVLDQHRAVPLDDEDRTT